MRLILISAILSFLADQASKIWVVHVLDLANTLRIEVWPPYVNFHMGWNTGINFGLFAGGSETQRWVLVVLSLVVSLWLLRWGPKHLLVPLQKVSAGLIIGGALGNALDRVVYGAVADFLNITCCGMVNPFAFNIADMAIFAGAAGLLFVPHKVEGEA